MKILGNDIEFDFCEVENMARYERGLEEYMKDLEEVKNFKGKESEAILQLCKIVYKFFDNVIGKGTANKIFGTKNNFANCTEAMGQMIKAKEDSIRNVNELIDKYITKEG